MKDLSKMSLHDLGDTIAAGVGCEDEASILAELRRRDEAVKALIAAARDIADGNEGSLFVNSLRSALAAFQEPART